MKTLLRNHPAAQNFVSLMATNVGRDVKFGNPEKVGVSAAPHVSKAHIAMREAIDKTARLVDDATRTEAAKHAAAAQVVAKPQTTIRDAGAALKTAAEDMRARAADMTASFAAVNRNDDAGIRSELRQFIRDKSANARVLAELMPLVRTDPTIAAEIVKTPSYLLGMKPEAHEKLMAEVQAHHVRDAAETIIRAQDIEQVIPNYEKTANELGQYIYNPALAEKGETRVET